MTFRIDREGIKEALIINRAKTRFHGAGAMRVKNTHPAAPIMRSCMSLSILVGNARATSMEFGSSISGSSEPTAAAATAAGVTSYPFKANTDRETPVPIIKWALPIIMHNILSLQHTTEFDITPFESA
jgi:hypothetical protein